MTAPGNIGDVHARVTADTGQFRAAMMGSVATMTELRNAVRAAANDLRLGTINYREYATVVAVARKEAAGLRAQQKLLAPTALEAGKGISTLRNSLAIMATSALGVRGPLGTVTSTLAFLAVGNLTALGIIAGIAAIAKAFELVRSRANAARDAIKAAVERGIGLRGGDPRFERPLLLGDIRVQEAEQARLNSRLRVYIEAGKQQHVVARDLSTQLGKVNAALIQYRRVLDELDERDREAVRKRDEENAALAETARRYEDARAAAGRLRAEMAFQARGFGRPLDVFGNAGQRGLGTPLGFTSGVNPPAPQVNSDEALNTFRRLRAEMKLEWTQAGEDGAFALVRGFTSALRGDRFNLGALLRNVFASLLEDVIIQAIRRALARAALMKTLGIVSGGIGSFLGLFHSGGVVPGPRGQEGLAVVKGGETVLPTHQGPLALTVNVGPPPNPMAWARDREWQNALREGLRVAGAQGFRMQGA